MKYSTANMRMWSRLGPSGSLGATAVELGKEFDKVLFLSADMTFAAGLERFRNAYPDRLYNMGIAEQNLVGVAAGLASEGYIPFAITYATFLATRALDQVKMNLGYMKLPVKLVGLNAGFAAGILGPTHMAIEDISAMRSIPNMTVVAPSDMTEVCKALSAAVEYDGPMYIRLTGEMNQPQIYIDDYGFRIGKAVLLKEGFDIAIISCGTITYNCCKVAERLYERGISVKVINMHTIKPLDKDMLESVLGMKLIVTVEEHNSLGGLGSAIAEYISSKKNPPVLCRLGVNDLYPHSSSYQSLLVKCGLDVSGIEESILKTIGELGL